MGFLTSLSGAIFADMMDPTGFVTRTTSTLAFNSGSLTFTIAPTAVNFPVYSAGQLFYKTAESIVISNTVGLHYIYYVNGVTLAESMTAWDIASANVPIATVFWNGTTGYLYDERHGIQMDGRTHEYLHETVGARFALGLDLTIAADCLTHTISLGEWYDDDIEWEPPAQSSTPFAYRIGSAWQKTAAQAPAFYTLAGVPQYNNSADPNGLVDVDNNKYFCTWIVITNTYPNSESVFVMGTAQYNTQALAEAETPPALSTAPSAELLLLYQIVMQRVGAAIVWKHTTDLRRTTGIGSNYIHTDHGTLAGLSDDDHIQYLLASDAGNRATFAANWTDLTDSGATTLHTHAAYLRIADIDDTPVDTETAAPISSNWAFDHVAAADPHTGYLKEADIDDVPVDGETAAPISSNWAFDHVAAADPHTGYVKENDANWTDLTDTGETTLHTHPGQLSATDKTDLTDAGATTLHKHDHGGMDGLADNDHPSYWVLLAESLLAGDATSFLFNSFPSTYRSLALILHGYTDAAGNADNIGIRFNNDTGNNYATQYLVSSNLTATPGELLSQTQSFAFQISGSAVATKSSGGILFIPNYNNATREKSGYSHGSSIYNTIATSGNIAVWHFGWHWSGTAAITSFYIFPTGGTNFKSGTVASLYGIPDA